MSKITIEVDLDDLETEVDNSFKSSLVSEFDYKLRSQVREKTDELVKNNYNEIGAEVKKCFDECFKDSIEKYCKDKIEWVDKYAESRIKEIISNTVRNNKYLIESNMRDVIKSAMKQPMADYLKNKANEDLESL